MNTTNESLAVLTEISKEILQNPGSKMQKNAR